MRALSTIALEIENDASWRLVSNNGAKSMLDHMKNMGLVTEPFYGDPDGYGVVSSFLSNAIGWKGPVARCIKKELRTMCGHPRP
jgi:hypothetical protein